MDGGDGTRIGAILPRLPAPEDIRLRAPGGPPLRASLWGAPAGAPGVVVVPGFGSRRGNHADFAAAAAGAGMAALTLDVRGHGESGGRLDGGALDDVLAAVAHLAARGHAPLGVRGSSMGGFLALHAAAREPRVRAVVAICPARPDGLARTAGGDWPLGLPLEPAVERADGVARGFWHATGDDRVPWSWSFALADRAHPPVRLHVAMGGGHGTLQHDPAVIAATVRFLRAHLRTP
jgi:pimeloyl-ACP methyl ester carboxylesterase